MPITLNTGKLNIKKTGGSYIPITAIIEEGASGGGSDISPSDISQINQAVIAAQTSANSAATSANDASISAQAAAASAESAEGFAQDAQNAVGGIATNLLENDTFKNGITNNVAENLINNNNFNTNLDTKIEDQVTDQVANKLIEFIGMSDDQIPWVKDSQGEYIKGWIANIILDNKAAVYTHQADGKKYWLTPPPQPGSVLSGSWKYTDYIPIAEGIKAINFETTAPDNTQYNAFYTNKPAEGETYNVSTFIQNFVAKGSVPVPNNAKYFRLSLAPSYKVNFRFDYYVTSYLDDSEILYTQSYGGIPIKYDIIRSTKNENNQLVPVLTNNGNVDIIENSGNAYSNYISQNLYTYEGTIKEGETYTINADTIKNNPNTSPFYIELINSTKNSQTQPEEYYVQYAYANSITITAADLLKQPDKIIFKLYPTRNGDNLSQGLYPGLFNNGFLFENLSIVKSKSTGISLAGNLRSAVVDTINNPYNLPDYYFYYAGTSGEAAEQVAEKDNYILKKISKINELGRKASDMFIFITDEHWSNNRKLSPGIINYISNYCHISKIFSGGDSDDGYVEGFSNELRKAFPYKIYHVMGNHEWKKETTGEELYYLMDSYNNDQIGNPEGHYYYVDNVQQGIRYIILNAFKIIKRQKKDANGNPMSDNQNNPIIEYKEIGDYDDNNQFNWFEQTLENTPSEWDVIIFTHYFGQSKITNNEVNFMPLIMDVNNPPTPNESADDIIYTQRYADLIHQFNTNGEQGDIFTDRNGKILAIFQGHMHVDAIYHTGPAEDGGIPIITTTCDKCGRNSYEEDYLSAFRVTNDISEQAFDVVAIEKKIYNDPNTPEKMKRDVTITCERIGAKAMNNEDIPIERWYYIYPEEKSRKAIVCEDDIVLKEDGTDLVVTEDGPNPTRFFKLYGTLETRKISLTFDYDTQFINN